MINLLITSAGRRVELVQELSRARQQKGISGSIVCADMSELAPALYFADQRYRLPHVHDPEYLASLIGICNQENIHMIIPTIDTELHPFTEHKTTLALMGTDVLISPSEVVNIARDKYRTYEFFSGLGILTPRSYRPAHLPTESFPCFIKPNSGSSSINAYRVQTADELAFFKNYIGDYIVQEYIQGEEYTIDVFCDLSGNPIYITPRIRLATRSGEVTKTKIVHDDRLTELVLKIIAALKPKGPLTIQAIKSVLTHEYYFIEINARWGGGCPLSIKAGADAASALYDLLLGKNLTYTKNAAKEGLLFLRYDQSITVSPLGSVTQPIEQ